MWNWVNCGVRHCNGGVKKYIEEIMVACDLCGRPKVRKKKLGEFP